MKYPVPPGFEEMASYAQWVLWKLVPDPEGGKPKKVPCNSKGVPCDHTDDKNWLTWDQAAAARELLGPMVSGWGFSFAECDPFGFFDVDGALVDGKWSEVAEMASAAFPGALREISQSGKGFHIFFKTSRFFEHRNRRDDWGLELYVTGRFCANTFDGVTGDTVGDRVAQYERVAAGWFKPAPKVVIDLTDMPSAAQWISDEELVKRMLGQVGTPGKATVRQLWAGGDELGAFFVDVTGKAAFNHSSADLALCSALAFWTGRDAARMERLFNMSGLNRHKWESRPQYRADTIKLAIEGCTAVYQGRSGEGGGQVAPAIADELALPPSDLAGNLADGPPAELEVERDANGVAFKVGHQFLTPEQQRQHFAGCHYVIDKHEVFTPQRGLLNPQRFNAVFGGYLFGLDHESAKSTKHAFEVFTIGRALDRVAVDTTVFRPASPTGELSTEPGGLVAVNTYRPAQVEAEPGNVDPFLQLVHLVFPDERDRAIALSTAASIVQNPGHKNQWCLGLQGVPGNGKTFFTACIAAAVGEHFVHRPNASDIANKFNAGFEGKLFVIVEEIRQSRHATSAEVYEALKILITNERIEFQGKGANQYTGENHFNLMLTTNFKEGLRKTADDRRICPIYTAQQTKADLARDGMLGNFFPELWGWWKGGAAKHVNHYLQHFAIVEQFNPAGSCTRAPDTSSTNEAIAVSLNEAEARIAEAIAEGRPGFAGGWVDSIQLEALFERAGGTTRPERQAALEALGYVRHPALRAGRSPIGIAGDGGRKPRLYVLASNGVNVGLPDGRQVAAAYERAQQPQAEGSPQVEQPGKVKA